MIYSIFHGLFLSFFIQEDSISNQLDLGIRFLDLRIAHKIKDPNEVFYFAHGIYSLLTVKVHHHFKRMLNPHSNGE